MLVLYSLGVISRCLQKADVDDEGEGEKPQKKRTPKKAAEAKESAAPKKRATKKKKVVYALEALVRI